MSPESSPRTFVRPLLLVLMVAGVTGLAFKLRNDPASPEAPGTKPVTQADAKVPRDEPRVARRDEKLVIAPESETASAPIAEPRTTTPPPAGPGHEGHGDECAHCFGEKRLAACREDYALLCYSQVAETYAIDEAKTPQVLDACRRFAASVLKEWSHSESKPLLPADEIVDARRREIVGPVLTGLAERQADDR